MSTRNPIILSIDDDKRIQFSLNALLSSQGFVSIQAYNVLDGLNLFKEYSPDMVLMDYHMSGTGGIRGVELLRNLNATVPILVLTVEESQSVADAFLAAGANDFALKPVRAPDILARIRLHLSLSAQMNQQERGGYTSKGIVPATRDCIIDFLVQQDDEVTLDVIAQGSGLAYQTVSRYLNYLINENVVTMHSVYGKVGRPRQHYRLAKKD